MARAKTVFLVSNGDYRDPACVAGWPLQQQTLQATQKALKKLGWNTVILPEYDSRRRHGFITRQCEGTAVFSKIDPEAPVIVVLNIWAYAHHVCGPLQTHRGPILLLANFDGTWPGLVALLNHSASLDRLNVRHSRLWSESFSDDPVFMKKLAEWIETGQVKHDTRHLVDGAKLKLKANATQFGEQIAKTILTERCIMGQFDPGCMGMLNAVMDPAKLGSRGMPIEYLNQSDLVAEMNLVDDREAQKCLDWLIRKG